MINPFDILSGKVVKNQDILNSKDYTEHFGLKTLGITSSVGADGYPKFQRLHRDNSLPAAVSGLMETNTGIKMDYYTEKMIYQQLYTLLVSKNGIKMENGTEIMTYLQLYMKTVFKNGIKTVNDIIKGK